MLLVGISCNSADIILSIDLVNVVSVMLVDFSWVFIGISVWTVC